MEEHSTRWDPHKRMFAGRSIIPSFKLWGGGNVHYAKSRIFIRHTHNNSIVYMYMAVQKLTFLFSEQVIYLAQDLNSCFFIPECALSLVHTSSENIGALSS